jgi:2-keto-4-pentenoate hydratase/2-oxohepta-3-ene-1,7-dioic acid hydratase in catechol pathway
MTGFAIGSLLDGAAEQAALRIDGRAYRLSDLARAAHVDLPGTTLGLFAQWQATFPVLEDLARSLPGLDVPAVDEPAAVLGQPVRPRKVFCVGANYADHLAEMGNPAERQPGRAPFFFLKPATTALCGPGDTVRIPRGCTFFDWEVEVVVVFGAGGGDIPPGQAMNHVAGYTLGIDFTARDQFVDPGLLFKFNFSLGKCQDDTAPIGPWIVPSAYLDGRDVDFSLDVNGTRKQSSNTRQMLYGLDEQIAEISRRIRIEPGDILFTGSPAGVGFPRGESVKDGDQFTARATGIGELMVTARASGIKRD